MQECVLPCSPNWFLSSASSGNDSGLYAFGARNSVYIYDIKNTHIDCVGDINIDNEKKPNLVPKLVACYMEHLDKITAVCLSPESSQWICCSSDDSSVRLWDIRSLVTIQIHNEHKEKITCMSWSPRNLDNIFTASEKGTVVVWKLKSNTVRSFRIEKEFVYCIKASPHSASHLAIGYRTGLALIVEVDKDRPKILQRLRGHEGEITSICWSPIKGENFLHEDGEDDDGALIATAGRRSIKIWSSTKGKEVLSKKLPQGSAFRGDFQDPMAKKQWLEICWPKTLPHKLISTSSGQPGELFLIDLSKKGEQKLESFVSKNVNRHTRMIFNLTLVDNKLCSFALDRTIGVWSLESFEGLCLLSSFGGYIYSIRESPLDPGCIAIGAGDNTIRIWNQSNKSNPFDMSCLYHGIKSKITTVAWHPEKEGLLAYGTEDGRVGVYNTLVAKPPTMSSTFHNKTVYVVCWAPPIQSDAGGCQVYSIGDGTILQHFIGDSNKSAVSLVKAIQAVNGVEKEKLIRSELSWRKDFSAFAVGHDNGSVSVYSFPSLKHMYQIAVHRKFINCLRWHPETTAESPGGSQCSYWLALAGNDSTISVVDLTSALAKPCTDISSPIVITHVSCQVDGHGSKTTDLCWSPHRDGMLASVGYDNTAMVWDMQKCEVVSTYGEHNARLMTVCWSSIDPDCILTGGLDATVRLWKVSTHPGLQLNSAERRKKKKRVITRAPEALSLEEAASEQEIQELQDLLELKRQQLSKIDTVDNRDALEHNGQAGHTGLAQQDTSRTDVASTGPGKLPDFVQPSAVGSSTREPSRASAPPTAPPTDEVRNKGDKDSDLLDVIDLVTPVKPLFPKPNPTKPTNADVSTTEANKKRKVKVKSFFPVSAAANNRGKSCQQEDILDLTRIVTGQGSPDLLDSKPHLGIFGDRLGAHRCLLQESEYHLNNDNMEYHLQLELWRGNIAGAVQIARQRNELSDWIVAMAPLASHDLWELVSAEYAEQLEEDGQYHKAATYLLAAHKVHQAIDLFRRHRLFREAVSLAKMRLSPVDSLLEDLYTEWGQSLMKDGQFEQAAKCYLAMRHIQEAGKALTRRLDQSSLKTACHMTILANDTQQGLSYAFKLFSQNFVMGEWQEAYTFIQEHESLKFLLPLVSTHEMLVQQLAVMCPGLNLTHKPLTPDMFAHWDQKETANNKITLPEFLVDKSEIDPVVPWEPFLIDEHTFPHHLLRSWYKHFDINMVTQELTAMHAAISQLVSLRQNLGDLPSLLVMVSMDITLCLLVLLTSDTSKAIVHLIEAMSTLYNSKHKTLHQALCRLMLPQGPKYLLKLQQEFNASRVLITMESHGDVNKAGGEGHNSIKKFLSDIKDDSSISTPSVRCRELDCLRAYYYLAVLDFVRDGFPNGQQEEDIFDGMPNQVFTDPNSCVREFKNKELSSSVDPSCLTTPCVDTLIKNIHNSFGNISDLDQNGRISQAPVSDGRISQAPVSGANLNSDKKTLCAGDLQSQPGHQKNLAQEYSAQSYSVDPPVVPFSQKKTPLPITAQQGRKSPLPTTPVKSPTDSIKSSKTSPTTSLHRQTSAQKGHLTNTNLLRLSKGILWDVQAKREALTETLGYIHRAISQHLLTVRPAEEHKSGCAMSPTPSSSSCKTSTDGRGLEEDGSCHQTRLSPSPLSPTTSEILNTGKTPVRPTFFNTNTSNNSESTSPKDNDSNEKSKSSGSNSGGERTRSLSPKSPNLNELSSRGPFRSKSDNSSLSPLSPSSALDPCVALQVEHDLLGHYDGNQVTFQKPTKVLWLDGRGSSVDQSPTSPKPAFNLSKLAPDGSTIPIEWYDLPIDVKYTQPYVTLALLKHEEDAVNQELKRVPEISHVPFPPTRNSIRRLLDACLNSPHLSKEEKHSYFKQLNDWAVLFAVTTHQQTETDTLFSSAALEHFTAG